MMMMYCSNKLFLVPILLLVMMLSVSIAHRRGRPPPPFGPPPPAFLRDASPEARRDYMRLVTTSNDTKAELRTKLEAWAQQNGVKVINRHVLIGD